MAKECTFLNYYPLILYTRQSTIACVSSFEHESARVTITNIPLYASPPPASPAATAAAVAQVRYCIELQLGCSSMVIAPITHCILSAPTLICCRETGKDLKGQEKTCSVTSLTSYSSLSLTLSEALLVALRSIVESIVCVCYGISYSLSICCPRVYGIYTCMQQCPCVLQDQ